MGLSLVTPKKLIWNRTESIPLGLYWVQNAATIQKGELIVFRFQDRWLLKEVVGVYGDLFCVSQEGDFQVNEDWIGKAKKKDTLGNPQLRVLGCQKVLQEEWVVRGYGERSFDSRYFGTVQREQILGKAIRIGGKNPEAKAEGKIKH